MNYQKIYKSIIKSAISKNRVKVRYKKLPNYVYYEKHHIIPKCLGGTNINENLVLLTAREHYICHKILTYLYPHNRGIVLAFHRMTFDKNTNRKISSRDYLYAKKLKASTSISEKTREKMKAWPRKKGKDNSNFGSKRSEITILKLKNPKSIETKEKFSKARKGKSYDEFYGEKSSYMKQKRKEQTSGSGNPRARKYIIFNSKLDKKWFCYGNLSKFGKEFHVSAYKNDWKIEPFDENNENHKDYIVF